MTGDRAARHPDAALIAALQERVETALRPLVPRGAPVALLDFPDYANVGDSAIWLGQLEALEALGVERLVYTCDASTYSRRHLAARIGDGTLLFTGGGNFGDLWPRHQAFRERVLADFPRNPAVFLPQTIHFATEAAIARARAAIDGHGGVTILVRDARSFDQARRHFRARVTLCPDGAVCLGPLARPRAPSQPVVVLARTDIESARFPLSPEPGGMDGVDWTTDDSSLALGVGKGLSWALVRYPHRLAALRGPLSGLYRRMARERVARGCRLLSRGETVVTDRLHGHILCLLLGIPHYVLDNSYGKVRGFHEAWTHGSTLARWCASWPEAMALATAEKTDARQPLGHRSS